MVQHLIDTERVFQYRAVCFARKDKTNLPGFDENLFSSNADAETRNKKDLIYEFEVVLQSGSLLFQSFTEEQLQSSGIANGKEVYVEGMGFIMLGHVLHHIGVLKERYL
ncbi:MAG: DNA damage-inducible protein DinB [Chitinophagaceae bacterium]